MFLFLALAWACVAAAQCHDAEPHLQKRDWVDGDRHCSYRENVVFESFSREFDVGCGDGVHVLSPEGDLLGKIVVDVPSTFGVSNLCFGPPHADGGGATLYILNGQKLVAVEVLGTAGAPAVAVLPWG